MIYRQGADHLEYRPDMIARAADTKCMREPKAGNQLDDDRRTGGGVRESTRADRCAETGAL